jgi:hypothetical protein
MGAPKLHSNVKKNADTLEETQPLAYDANPFWQSTLFSDVYLRNEVPNKYRDVWENDSSGTFHVFCERFRDLCDELEGESFENWSERTTINRFIKPVLKLLGWSTTQQDPWIEDESFSVKESGESKTYKPDFLIVHDPKQLKYIEKKTGDSKLEEARLSSIISIEAKYWGRIDESRYSRREDKIRADKRGQSDATNNMDFDEQCLKYVELLHHDYGILTDGRTWRLFHKDLSSGSFKRCYQFNLGYLIKHVQAGLDKKSVDYLTFVDNAKYFYHFFSKSALFNPDGGRRFVDDLISDSRKYSNQVEEDLKVRFVSAMSIACNGFRRSLGRSFRESHLELIRSVSESHIFNILFIRYCESRNILPIRQNPEYRKASLSNVIDKLDFYDPEKERDDLNTPTLKRRFREQFEYSPDGHELYSSLLNLVTLLQDGLSHPAAKFSIVGFHETVFTAEEIDFARRHQLTNREMAALLFELTYIESERKGQYQQISYSFFAPRQLGSIYESFLEFRIEEAHVDMAYVNGQWKSANLASQKISALNYPTVQRGHLFFSPDNADRKATGSYYTPDEIVQFVITNTLGSLTEGKSSKDILSLRVVDPAMGSGHFLCTVLNYLSRKYLSILDTETTDDLDIDIATAKELILRNCIFGVDINSRAVKLAKMSLWLESAMPNRRLEPLDDQLKFGDSLVDDLPGYPYNFDWEKSFQGIKFDAVIGNPPWISILGKFKVKSIDSTYANHLVNKYGLDTNRPNVYEAFVRKGLSLIAQTKGGKYGVILPEGLGINKQFMPLRELILDKFDLELVAYGFDFPGVTMDTGVFVISNSRNQRSFRGGLFPKIDQEISLADVRKDPLYTFNVSRREISSQNKLADMTLLVEGGICKSFTGFIAAKNALREDSSARTTKVLKGRDIQPFQTVSAHFIVLDKSNMIGGTQDYNILQKKPKILLRKTGAKLIATLDLKGIPIEQSLYGLYDITGIEPELLVCYLNSDFATDYYQNSLVTNRTATPHLKKMHLDQFPVPLKGLLAHKKDLLKLYAKATAEGFTERVQDELNKIITVVVSGSIQSKRAS